MAKVGHLHIHRQGVGIRDGSPNRLLYHLLAYHITYIFCQQAKDVGLATGDEHTRATGAKFIVAISKGGLTDGKGNTSSSSDMLGTTEYKNHDTKATAFLQYQGSAGKWSWSAGIRYEHLTYRLTYSAQ